MEMRISSLPGALPVSNFATFRRRDGARCGRSCLKMATGEVLELSHLFTVLSGTPDWEQVRRQTLHVRASLGGRRIGTIVMRRVQSDGPFAHAHVWDTYSFSVDEKYRRRGVARAMYGHVREIGIAVARAAVHSRVGKDFWDSLAFDLQANSGEAKFVDDRSEAALQDIWSKSQPFIGLLERSQRNQLAFLEDELSSQLLGELTLAVRPLLDPRLHAVAPQQLAGMARRTKPQHLLRSELFCAMLSRTARFWLSVLQGPKPVRQFACRAKSMKREIRSVIRSYGQFSTRVRTLFAEDDAAPYARCERCDRNAGCLVKIGMIEVEARTR